MGGLRLPALVCVQRLPRDFSEETRLMQAVPGAGWPSLAGQVGALGPPGRFPQSPCFPPVLPQPPLPPH